MAKRPALKRYKVGQALQRRDGPQNDQTLINSYAYASAGKRFAAGRSPPPSIYISTMMCWSDTNLCRLVRRQHDFDDSKVGQITKKRPRDPAVQLIGKPSGYYVYPMIVKEGDAAVYAFSEVRGMLEAYRKTLAERLTIGSCQMLSSVLAVPIGCWAEGLTSRSDGSPTAAAAVRSAPVSSTVRRSSFGRRIRK
jgi:hypothetical protein